VFDHALTQPWTVDKRFIRNPDPRPKRREFYCTENSAEISIGQETYFMSGDGMLMPSRKDQPPPDLRYFKRTQK
jgi:hypothetical protein